MKSPANRFGIHTYFDTFSDDIQAGFHSSKWLKAFRIYSNSQATKRSTENDFINGFSASFDDL